MTILELNNKVYQYLLEHDEVTVDSFISDNSIIHDDIEYFKKLLTSVLRDFTAKNILREIDNKWILTQPISSYSQVLELSASNAVFISEILGKWAAKLEDKNMACDALKISDKDIRMLIAIATEYYNILEKSERQ